MAAAGEEEEAVGWLKSKNLMDFGRNGLGITEISFGKIENRPLKFR